ncbi:MAG: ribose 5-phosphate isomerase B [Planctomycetes bacterium]|nr:ribose 5-phosphate isomerase B [Planctomycetota bacterium]
MRIAVGADHRGTEVRAHLIEALRQLGHEVVDKGNSDGKACDYPDVAYTVAQSIAKGESERGILVCGTGIGMSIAANKVRGIRAALVHDEIGADLSRRHNDANVLCLSADMLGLRIIDRIVKIWMNTPFEGSRHLRCKRKITAIEDGHPPDAVTDEPA